MRFIRYRIDPKKLFRLAINYLNIKFASFIDAYVLKTKLYVRTSENQKALSTIEKAFALNDSDPQIILLFAYVLELNGKTKKAVAMYEKLIEVVPLNEAITNNMLALYRELGDLESSLQLLKELDKKLTAKIELLSYK